MPFTLLEVSERNQDVEVGSAGGFTEMLTQQNLAPDLQRRLSVKTTDKEESFESTVDSPICFAIEELIGSGFLNAAHPLYDSTAQGPVSKKFQSYSL